jgi:hypothetical protein
MSDQLPSLSGLYTATLGGTERGAMGHYELGSGRLVYYNDGGKWFFGAGTRTPAFYIEDGAIYFAHGVRYRHAP